MIIPKHCVAPFPQTSHHGTFTTQTLTPTTFPNHQNKYKMPPNHKAARHRKVDTVESISCFPTPSSPFPSDFPHTLQPWQRQITNPADMARANGVPCVIIGSAGSRTSP